MGPSRRMPLILAALLLILPFFQNASWAAPHHPLKGESVESASPDAPTGHRLWSFLVSTWQFAGCTVDPLGGSCLAREATPAPPLAADDCTSASSGIRLADPL